jgi:sialate O-acetylesterase
MKKPFLSALLQTLLFSTFLCLFFLVEISFAQIHPAKIFSENAVLQRNKPIPVWGWAKPLENIRVSLGNQHLRTTTDENGKWIVKFPAMEAGGPYVLSFQTQDEKLELKNILIGEVWLGSGQSNMEWTVKHAKDFEKEKEDADYPNIRHFYVEHKVTIDPQNKLENGDWKISSKETVGDFTAIGFFFARKIYKELGIPVGLIHSSWGGSQIEGWISKEAMLSSDEFRDYAAQFPRDWKEADARLLKKIKKITLGDENATPTKAFEKKYTGPGYDFSKWHKAGGMWQWDWQGIWAWRGNGYMAKTAQIPAGLVGKETMLGLAEGHQSLQVFINGKNVFYGILKGKREIIIPKNTWQAGENRIVIKMDKMIEPEWFGLGFMGSADDLFVKSGSEKIGLGGNDWYLMPAFSEDFDFARLSNNAGTILYNGMIAPLVPYGIRGVLWYQGETNAGRAVQYRKAFPLLIKDWRAKWDDEFPFYFVQLASFGSNNSSNIGSWWPELREAQLMTLSLPKTGMAVTTDIGNPTDIHPVNKQDVALRLAANALKLTYGRDIPHSSPLFDSVKFEKSKAAVKFKFVYKGLEVKDKFGYLRGFEIAGEDKVFYYAQAEIKGDEVIVSHPKVPNPVAVRYAWSDAPVDANLYNSAGFPASPFRTDDWPLVTRNNKFIN